MVKTKQYKCALLVDDDPVSNYINRLVISDLDNIGHAHDAKNGADAIKFIDDHCHNEDFNCPDLILLDLNMPVMDGFEFLKSFKEMAFKQKKDVTIVILTSSTNPKDIERAAEFNVHGYINKPLTAEHLDAVLDQI